MTTIGTVNVEVDINFIIDHGQHNQNLSQSFQALCISSALIPFLNFFTDDAFNFNKTFGIKSRIYFADNSSVVLIPFWMSSFLHNRLNRDHTSSTGLR